MVLAAGSGRGWRLPVAVGLALGVLLSLVMFFLVRTYEERAIATHFGHLARDTRQALERELLRDGETVAALGHFFAATGEVTRAEFRRFTVPVLAGHPELRGLGWAPRVAAAERAAFERRVRARGRPGFRVRRFDDGPAAGAETAYPVLFTTPAAGSATAVGQDLASEPVRRAALEAARDAGDTRMSAPVELADGAGDPATGYLLFHPVYTGPAEPEGAAERRRQIAGFAVGAYRVADLLQAALPAGQRQLFDLTLEDTTGGRVRALAVPSGPGGSPGAAEGPLHWRGEVAIWGRTWRLTAVPTDAFQADHRRFDSWAALAVGLLLTLGLGYYLFTSRRRFALLERAQRQWRDTFDAVPDPIFLHDHEGRLLRVNRAYARHAGRALPELLGRPYWEVFPRRAGPTAGCIAAMGTAMEASGPERLAAGGRAYRARDFPVRDQAGGYRYCVHVLEDVTEQERAEAAARAEQERARSYLDIASTIILALDRDGRVTLINRAGCELLGYPEHELVGADWFETALPPGWRERVQGVFEGVVEGGGGPRYVENPVVTRAGEERVIAWHNVPLQGPDGTVTGTLSSGMDITERKEWELRLQASEERLQLALEGARDGLWDWDIRNDRVYFSPRWKQLLGYDEGEIGEGFDEWRSRVHPDDLEAAEAAVRSALAEGGEYFANEFRMRHKDGHQVWVLARARILRDPSGRPMRMVGTHLDITDIKAAQRREAEARAALEERVKELRCLHDVTGLAFDLERPVAAVLVAVARRLPAGWQRPEATSVRIRWAGEAYHSDGFAVSERVQAAPLRLRGEDAGGIEVFVDAARTAAGERPFLAEEDALLASVARELEHALALRDKEAALERVNRVLLTLSESNRSLVRAVDEDQLTQALCDILVANGDYALAWVGYRDAEGGGLYQVAAATSPELGPLAPVAVASGSDESLALQALESGHTEHRKTSEEVACPVCASDTAGCHSGIALPLTADATPFGVLAVCSTARQGMDPQEIELFEELAGDLAYGITSLRTRDQRDRALTAYDELLFQTIKAIALTVEKRDPYTAGHQQRVAELAAAIAAELGWADDTIHGLRLGGIVHDLGKVYIPAEILNRPGRLTDQEFALIQTHPDVGYEIIQGIAFPWPVGEMVRQHHERLDGSGYPKGLSGDEIIPEARVLAVADVVEAVTAHRPYRPGLGEDKALAVVREGRGTLFDPEAVDACTRLFEEGRFVWAEPT